MNRKFCWILHWTSAAVVLGGLTSLSPLTRAQNQLPPLNGNPRPLVQPNKVSWTSNNSPNDDSAPRIAPIPQNSRGSIGPAPSQPSSQSYLQRYRQSPGSNGRSRYSNTRSSTGTHPVGSQAPKTTVFSRISNWFSGNSQKPSAARMSRQIRHTPNRYGIPSSNANPPLGQPYKTTARVSLLPVFPRLTGRGTQKATTASKSPYPSTYANRTAPRTAPLNRQSFAVNPRPLAGGATTNEPPINNGNITHKGPVYPDEINRGVEGRGKPSLTELRRQIEKACGNQARLANLHQSQNGALELHIHARSVQEGDAAFERIIRLPDVALFRLGNVKVDVK